MKSIIYRSILLARLAFLGLGALGGLGIGPSVITEVAWGQENKFLCPNKGFEIRSNKVRFNLRHAMSAILYG